MEDKNILEAVEAVDTEETAESTEYQEEKKYTDSEVDEIVKRRLGRERARVEKMQARQHQESELERRERELDIRERKADAREELQSKGLPKSLCNLLDYSSEDSYKASMAAADSLVQEIVTALELKRARGTTPKAYRSGNADPVRDAFNKK